MEGNFQELSFILNGKCYENLERIHTILWHNIKNKNKEILDAEMWDIFKVLKIAEQKTVTSHPLLIGIFFDSQTAIKKLKSSGNSAGQALKIQIHHKTKLLRQQGHEISVYWVPSHSGLEENNEKVDAAAKNAAMGGRSQLAKWPSLRHVK